MRVWISLIIGLMAVGTCLAGSSKPKIYLRVHIQADKSARPSTVIPVRLSNPNEMIYVGRYAEVTEKDIAAFQVIGKDRLLLVLSDRGKNQLYAATAKSIGKVLVVICNGRVLYSPMIDVPLESGKLLLPAALSEAELEELQKVIAKKSR